MARMVNRGIFQPLSPREKQALRLFHAGFSREEIAKAIDHYKKQGQWLFGRSLY